MDVKNMQEHASETFDIVIDKACLDCLYVCYLNLSVVTTPMKMSVKH